MIFVSCEKEQLNSVNNSNVLEELSTTEQYSGREYFKAIFFLDSDLTDRISIIRDHKERLFSQLKKLPDFEEQLAEYREYSEGVLNKIHEIDPTFFDYYKGAMESGNPLTVRSALIRGEKIFTKALYSDKELLKYLIPLKDFIDDLDVDEIFDEDGNAVQENLIKQLEEYLKKHDYENTKNIMNSFGASGEGKYALGYLTVINIGIVFNGGVAINLLIASSLGVVMDAAVAVNTYVAVHEVVTFTSDSGGGRDGGGGNSCRPPDTGKDINVCPDGENTTVKDVFILDIVENFK